MLPEVSEKFFSNVATIHEHDTRSACLNHIYIQFKGTTRGQKAFGYSGVPIWDTIISHIETDCAVGTFKKLCTDYYSSIRKRTYQTEFRPTWRVSMLVCINISAY